MDILFLFSITKKKRENKTVANYEFSINYPNTEFLHAVVHFDISIFYISFFICDSIFFSLSSMFIYRLNIFCVLFILDTFFSLSVKLVFVTHCFYSLCDFILEWLSTSTIVYHCSKCYLVELLLRLAHKPSNMKKKKKKETFEFTTLTKALHFSNSSNGIHKKRATYTPFFLSFSPSLHSTIVIVTKKTSKNEIFLCRSLDSICIFHFPFDIYIFLKFVSSPA